MPTQAPGIYLIGLFYVICPLQADHWSQAQSLTHGLQARLDTPCSQGVGANQLETPKAPGDTKGRKTACWEVTASACSGGAGDMTVADHG